MYLKELHIEGFKSFGKSVLLTFPTRITAIVGPNGSGKSNVAEAFRFVLGEQSMKSMRGRRGEDLIFNGGNGANRANRAKVSIALDNSTNTLNNSFSEVILSRTVYRNGNNEYMINNTQVRHKDIIEILANANIGSTGHHIISQGEADRILHASAEERKEMLEDGLGLKLLQYRRTEAKKKLQRAQENIAETDLILRETTPHLRHLKRQVERYEKAKEAHEDLTVLYAKYLAYETKYITITKCDLQGKFDTLREKLKLIETQMAEEKKNSVIKQSLEELSMQEQTLDEKIRKIQDKKDIASREIGKIEGEYNAIKTLSENSSEEKPIGRKTVANLYSEIQNRHTVAQNNHKNLIIYILNQLEKILYDHKNSMQQNTEKRLDTLEHERGKLREHITKLKEQEEEYHCTREALQQDKLKKMTVAQQSEKNLLTLITEKNTVEQEFSEVRHALNILQEDEENVARELAEGAVLIGTAMNRYKEVIVPQNIENEDRKKQKERRHALERKKIELEAMGSAGGEEVHKEYKEVSERVDFLNKEKKDLLKSIRDCEEGIETIQKEVDTRFKTGIRTISKEFERFFKILFGGGKASVSIEKNTITKNDEEPEVRVGVTVQVALPHKKITAMEQLSGGERALVSIALLFAISQITPPPFLILDETDAALDEANSQRYGDMIESLAKKSQLILITHNRETMHHAGALYGVTMNTVGISTLLSVQFDEAIQTVR